MKLAALALALAACSSSSSEPRQLDAGRTRRQLPPPSGTVRLLPPFAIDPGGIGAYRLGASQAEIYTVMPEQLPHIALLDIANVVETSVVRCEADALLAGFHADQPVAFLAVLSPDIAKTDGGLAVGARREAVEAAGPPLIDRRVARDPRVFVPAANPGARYVLDDDRVVAILLVGNGEPAQVPAGPPPVPPPVPPDAAPADAALADGCGATLPGTEAELRAAALVTQGPARVVPACFTPEGREALVIAGETITVVALDHDHLRRVTAVEIRGLSWAATLRHDDRDDIVAVAEDRTDDELVLSVIALRLEGGKLTKLAEDPAYRVTHTNAQWIGARLADLQLYLSIADRADGFQIGGVLVHRAGNGVRDVAPLSPVSIMRRKRTSTDAPPPVPVDAGPPTPPIDAGVGPDAGG